MGTVLKTFYFFKSRPEKKHMPHCHSTAKSHPISSLMTHVLSCSPKTVGYFSTPN